MNSQSSAAQKMSSRNSKSTTAPHGHAANSSTAPYSSFSGHHHPSPDAHQMTTAMNDMHISSQPHSNQQHQQPSHSHAVDGHNQTQTLTQTETRFQEYPSYPTYEADSVKDFWEPPPSTPAAHQSGFGFGKGRW
jgi:hypothetical protein